MPPPPRHPSHLPLEICEEKDTCRVTNPSQKLAPAICAEKGTYGVTNPSQISGGWVRGDRVSGADYNGGMASFTKLNALATHQHGLLTAAQLLEEGFTKRMVAARVDDGFLQRRAKGVVQLAGTSRSWEQELMVAVLSAQAVASHRAGSRLWGFRTVDEEVEVSIRYPRTAMLEGVVVHRSRDLEPSDVTEVDGISVTTPERTICDLGLVFPEHEVLRILQHAIATELVLPRDLWMMRQRTSKQGRNGTGVLERVLDALPAGIDFCESGLEVQFLEVCDRFGIRRPVPQLPVQVAGRHMRLDFAWIAEQVFVEIDGASFHSSPAQIANDGGRQNALVKAGWTPLRFTAADLTNRPDQCAKTLSDLLGFVQKK